MASQPQDKAAKDDRPRRKWTDFEATVLMNLIIRNIHKTGLEKDEFSKLSDSTAPRHKHRSARRAKEVSDPDKLKYVDVATALNRALHKSDYTHDIPVEEVEKLLHFFLRDRKGAIAVIDRQPTARLTRSMHRIWNRGLNFLGTKTEWDNGRKAAEEVKRREDQERRLNVGNAGAISSDVNATGVHDGWGDDAAVAPPGDGWGAPADENNTDASAAAAAWGDVMDVDTPATAVNNPKANNENPSAEAGSGAWGSATVNSSKAAVANAEDPWGTATESTIEPSLAAAAWGEPEVSVTATVATSADWSVNEDPFATPLPPSLSDAVNKVTASSDARGNTGASATTNTNTRPAVESDAWKATSAGRTDPVSEATENAWGAIAGNSTAVLPSTTKDGPGKTADTAANPWGASAETALPSLHSTGDTAADPWGTSTTSFENQPVAMDWGTEVSNIAGTDSYVTKSVEQAGTVSISVDKPAPMSSDDPWGEPVQPVAVSGWGDDTENTQGHTSETAFTASLSHSESAAPIIKDYGQAQWDKTPAPATPNWGSAPKTSGTPVVSSGNMSLFVEDDSPPSGMNSSNDLQTPSRQNSNHSKQRVDVAESKINPDRLAMLAAVETDDNDGSDFETTADDAFDRGKKSFRSSATFGSEDNAIPLAFNRLARK